MSEIKSCTFLFKAVGSNYCHFSALLGFSSSSFRTAVIFAQWFQRAEERKNWVSLAICAFFQKNLFGTRFFACKIFLSLKLWGNNELPSTNKVSIAEQYPKMQQVAHQKKEEKPKNQSQWHFSCIKLLKKIQEPTNFKVWRKLLKLDHFFCGGSPWTSSSLKCES